LPFTNMSGDPEQEYFSDGISEDIITDLSKIAGLMVIARNSSFTYKVDPYQEMERQLPPAADTAALALGRCLPRYIALNG
jgi:TolB-like protein